jgi:hypothetical protein
VKQVVQDGDIIHFQFSELLFPFQTSKFKSTTFRPLWNDLHLVPAMKHATTGANH